MDQELGDDVIVILDPAGGSMRRHNPALPFIFADDAAVTRGDGVFESILITGGHPVNIDRHAERFCRSARLLDLPEPDIDYWLRATNEAVAEWDPLREGKCVWTLSRGRAKTGRATAWLTITPVPESVIAARKNGVSVTTVQRRGRRSQAKTLDYATTLAAQRRAKDEGFDDIIFVDGKKVLEAATASVVVVTKKGKIRTPVTGKKVLDGTTQAALFEELQAQGYDCASTTLSLKDLKNASSVWLVASTRLATRVTSLDGEKLAEKKVGADIRQALNEALTR